MGAHVVLFGPSTAGKTSLMLGLTKLEGEHEFNVDRTWTTRNRRPDEGDQENVFATPEEFERKRPDFLFDFRTFPTYEYGIEVPRSLNPKEIRLRILMPVFARKFRELIDAPTVFCSVSPFHSDPATVFRAREPDLDPADMEARLKRYFIDDQAAKAAADIHFQNNPGLDSAVRSLGSTIVHHLSVNASRF